ncbi:MAG: hypothetical protein LLF94_06580 [Chlamydiales bacterium]|nr:hypothetical protein [Chlamydiales bacterium]
MPTPVQRSDISSIIADTCKHLEELKTVGVEMNPASEDRLKAILVTLRKEANALKHKINESREIAPIEPKLRNDLDSLIYWIQHNPEFNEALGNLGVGLTKYFNDISYCFKNFESKVTKTEKSKTA